MPSAKPVELFFYHPDGNEDQIEASNKQPGLDNAGLGCAEGALSQEVCENVLRTLKIKKPSKDEIVRVRLTVEEVAVAQFEVTANFKPFVRAKKK